MGELSIRTADWKDLPEINLIYQYARKFMAEMGNPAQWGKKFPLESQIKKDIENRQLYVVETGKGICGVFALIIGPDPTYAEIEDGQWMSESEYGTIHLSLIHISSFPDASGRSGSQSSDGGADL